MLHDPQGINIDRLTGVIGIILLLGIAYLLSNNKKLIKLNIIGWGLGLQLSFAFIILKTPVGQFIFSNLNNIIVKLISFADAGSDFLFQSFVPGIGYHEGLINFAFRAGLNSSPTCQLRQGGKNDVAFSNQRRNK